MPAHQILNTYNIWTATNQFNIGVTLYDNSTSTSSRIKQTSNDMLINNLTNSEKIILKARSSGGTPIDVFSMEQTQMVSFTPSTIKYATNQYTDLKQVSQTFNIYSKAVWSSSYFWCQTAGGIHTNVLTLSTGSITLGVSSGICNIQSMILFHSLLTCSIAPAVNTQLVNKLYTDINFLKKNRDE